MHYRFGESVGVDIGGTKLLIRYREHSLRHATGAGFGAAALSAILRDFLAGLETPPATMGIAVPGLVGEDGSVVSCDVLPSLDGWQAVTALSGLGLRCWVVNDAKAALHATTVDLEPGLTAATVMVGTAVGCGVLAEGGVLRGACGWAGELGYWPIKAGGRWKRLDEVAGGQAMADRLGLDGEALYAAAVAGDPQVAAVVREGGEALGGALAGLLNLLNPTRLAVGGGALRLPGYWEAAASTLDSLALPALRAACSVVRVDGKADIVAQGAALMALERARC